MALRRVPGRQVLRPDLAGYYRECEYPAALAGAAAAGLHDEPHPESLGGTGPLWWDGADQLP